MARIREVRDIPLGDLVIGKGQVRVKNVGSEIDELAESIRVMGLLEPIVVCESDKAGKYEILTGQRRFLAVKQLKLPKISAAILDEKVDEDTAKAISLTENMMRRDISQKENIDACTNLFKKYGTIKAVSEQTGLPYRLVSQYVKYDRLIPKLKKLVDAGQVDMRVALRAQDAASVTGDPYSATAAADEAVKIAKEMSTMSGHQQKNVVSQRLSNPEASVDDVIESAKTGAKSVQILATVSATVHTSLQKYAKEENVTQDDAAASLIEEGLAGKGYMD